MFRMDVNGSKCYCSECKGKSLFTTFRAFALIFHAMENDDVIEKILDTVRQIDPDEDDLGDAIDQAMEENRDAILEKFNDATVRLEECSGSGLKLNPWIGQM